MRNYFCLSKDIIEEVKRSHRAEDVCYRRYKRQRGHIQNIKRQTTHLKKEPET